MTASASNPHPSTIRQSSPRHPRTSYTACDNKEQLSAALSAADPTIATSEDSVSSEAANHHHHHHHHLSSSPRGTTTNDGDATDGVGGSTWRERRRRRSMTERHVNLDRACHLAGRMTTVAGLALLVGPRPGGCATTPIVSRRDDRHQQRRHPRDYDPLNMTLIDDSPLLTRRYLWLRQSEAMERLLDGEISDGDYDYEAAAKADVHEYGLLDWFGTSRGGSGRVDVHEGQPREEEGTITTTMLDGEDNEMPLLRHHHRSRRLADDDDAINDDYFNNYNANAVVETPSPTESPTPPPNSMCYSKTCSVNEQCTKFLFGFLQGTTDAKDNCEGIMNAYVAADCGTIKKKEGSSTSGHSTNAADGTSLSYNLDDDFNDDYFGIFYDHQCCSSLRSHYYEYCDDAGILSGYTLLVVAAVMLLCECGKSIVKKNRIRWLPEAAACMLVGMAVALGAGVVGKNIENIGFDEEIFMYLLLPPIIFEAALTVNKAEFRRRRGSIIVFAVFGTLISSFITGAAVYYSAKYLGDVQLSILDSLVFGSLISSIDPVAILSVLTNLKMNETDTIYILVLGESLLNDGIAITLFKSLCQQYGSTATVTMDDILGSVADFMIISFGSCAIGFLCGVFCLCYFHLNFSIMNPVMEVASFFLWAVVPYWMSEALGWSGIVAIVVMGFFMDIYLRPGWDPASLELEEQHRQLMIAQSFAAPKHVTPKTAGGYEYYNWDDDDKDRFRFRGTAVDIPPRQSLVRMASEAQQQPPPHPNSFFPRENDGDTVAAVVSVTTNPNIRAILMKREFVQLSREADEHVRFVAHILSSLSENAIFAYLGLFIFSSKYKWDAILCSIGVTSCILSRAVMVISASWFIWYLHVFRQRAGCQKTALSTCVEEATIESKETNLNVGTSGSSDEINCKKNDIDPLNTPISKSARALSNYKVQVVLILAGLRGAVSLALVESIPIYNGVTGIGSKNKPLIKAMTSSSIIFTIFVLGGGAYYILKWLDISSDDMLIKSPNKSGYNSSSYYPPMVCGAPVCQKEMQEVELTRTMSWRSQTSFRSHLERSLSYRSETFAMPYIERSPSYRSRTFDPPLLAYSRSDGSHISYYSAGLNRNVVNLPLGDLDEMDVIKQEKEKLANDTLSPNDGEDPPVASIGDLMSKPQPGAPPLSHIV